MIRGILLIKALLLSILFSLAACSLFKADPAPDAGFSDNPGAMEDAHSESPFHRGWASSYWLENNKKYRNIIIAPVNTEHLLKASWWENQNSKTKESLEIDRQNIATFFRENLIRAYKEDPQSRFVVTDTPGLNTLVLEIAIVELVPAKKYFNLVSSIGGLFVPGASYVSSLGKGSIAIEGRVRDSQTGIVHVKFADRESDKSAPINLAAFDWYRGSKQHIQDWAEQLVMLGSSEHKLVAASSPFTLTPW